MTVKGDAVKSTQQYEQHPVGAIVIPAAHFANDSGRRKGVPRPRHHVVCIIVNS